MSPRRTERPLEGDLPAGIFARVFQEDLLSFQVMSRADVLVWLSIDRRCCGGQSYAFHSVTTIAEETGLLERTVKSSLRVLLELGAIQLGEKGERRTNSYKTLHRTVRAKRGESRGRRTRKTKEKLKIDTDPTTSDLGNTGHPSSGVEITEHDGFLAARNSRKVNRGARSYPQFSIAKSIPKKGGQPRLVIPRSPELVIPGSPQRGTCSDLEITLIELKDRSDAPARTIHEGRAAGSQEDSPADTATPVRDGTKPRKMRLRGPARLLSARSQLKSLGANVELTEQQEADLVELLESLSVDLFKRALEASSSERLPLSQFAAFVGGLNGSPT